MKAITKVGDNVFVSPDLTGHKQWIEAKVIEIEQNKFVGQVITVQSFNDGDIFFGRDYSFRKHSESCLQ